MYVCKYVYVCVCAYVCMYVCIQNNLCMHVSVYVFIHVRTGNFQTLPLAAFCLPPFFVLNLAHGHVRKSTVC